MGLFFSSPPCLDDFHLTEYAMPFRLDRLTPGVDNNRYDVCLSPGFCRELEEFILCLMEETTMPDKEKKRAEKGQDKAVAREDLKKSYQELMTAAINQAKVRQQVQVDYLARMAVATFVIREISNGFGVFVSKLRHLIQEKEMNRGYAAEDPVALKARLSEILLNKKQILRSAGKIVFELLSDVDQHHLNGIRKSNFGVDALPAEDFFVNPFLYAGKVDDDFMLQTYDILPGQRMDDADRYDLLLSTIRHRFMEMLAQGQAHVSDPLDDLDMSPEDEESREMPVSPQGEHGDNNTVDSWIRQEENARILFDFMATRDHCRFLKQQGEKKETLKEVRQTAKQQRRMLRFFYKKFQAAGVMERICAAFEIRAISSIYCPPLVPQVLLQFMLVPGSRKTITNRLKRLSKINHIPFPMGPLKRCQRGIKHLGRAKKEAYLIRFMKGFFRYHRDFQNFMVIEKAMDQVNLMTDEKQLRLSQVNNTLYAFLLPHEVDAQEKPVITHTILKADIRGSTDIVHRMKEKGLNPASYFSLNMFEPITQVLSDYGAFKVFIEGDAMILGIYEREEMPEGWYSVARASGLAMQILQIIQRYNVKNQQYHLPLLEIGIGITFSNEAPTLFFDGNFEIMISSAINLADRLSGCSKAIRKQMDARKPPFNNYVFQTASNEAVAATSDDIFTRYNVNGIELHPRAFEKLSREIRLKSVECRIPGIPSEKMRFFTGIFPTATGRYQRIVIRQGHISHVRKQDLELIATTDKLFYEVCTNPLVYDHFKKHEI